METSEVQEIIEVLERDGNEKIPNLVAVKKRILAQCGSALIYENLRPSRQNGRTCFSCEAALNRFSSVVHPLWRTDPFCLACLKLPRCVICERRAGTREYYLDGKNKTACFRRYQVGRYKGRNPLYVCSQCMASGAITRNGRNTENVIQACLNRIANSPLLRIRFDQLNPPLNFHQDSELHARAKEKGLYSVPIAVVDLHYLSRPHLKLNAGNKSNTVATQGDWGEDLVYGRCECFEHPDNCTPTISWKPLNLQSSTKSSEVLRNYRSTQNYVRSSESSVTLSTRKMTNQFLCESDVKCKTTSKSFGALLNTQNNIYQFSISERSQRRGHIYPVGNTSLLLPRQCPKLSVSHTNPNSKRLLEPETNASLQIYNRQLLDSTTPTCETTDDSTLVRWPKQKSHGETSRSSTALRREQLFPCRSSPAFLTPSSTKCQQEVNSKRDTTLDHTYMRHYCLKKAIASETGFLDNGIELKAGTATIRESLRVKGRLTTSVVIQKSSVRKTSSARQTNKRRFTIGSRHLHSGSSFPRNCNRINSPIWPLSEKTTISELKSVQVTPLSLVRCAQIARPYASQDFPLRKVCRKSFIQQKRMSRIYNNVECNNRRSFRAHNFLIAPSSDDSLTTGRILRVNRIGRGLKDIVVGEGLPEDIFASTLAHEFTHAYIFALGYHFPLITEEGICNAVCMLYVLDRAAYYSKLVQRLDQAIKTKQALPQLHSLFEEFFSVEIHQKNCYGGTSSYHASDVRHDIDEEGISFMHQMILVQERAILRHQLCLYRFKRMMFADTVEYLSGALILPILLKHGLHYCFELFHRHAKLRPSLKRQY